MTEQAAYRIGIDLGGTKILSVLIDETGRELDRAMRATPRNDYAGTIGAIADIVAELDKSSASHASVGIGTPGSMSPATGHMQNANSTWLNGRPFDRDVAQALKRPVRLANDANCFALSEAIDGAGANASSVFGVILGTGCGGGIVVDKKLVDGPHGIAGEWGHTALPWMTTEEYPGPGCWCGKTGCLETWLSGPGLENDHQKHTGEKLAGREIYDRARSGDQHASAALNRHADRLARGLGMIIGILDPEIIVLGGGLSEMQHLYTDLPACLTGYIFSDHLATRIVPPAHGPASGVRGAAWLWQPGQKPG